MLLATFAALHFQWIRQDRDDACPASRKDFDRTTRPQVPVARHAHALQVIDVASALRLRRCAVRKTHRALTKCACYGEMQLVPSSNAMRFALMRSDRPTAKRRWLLQCKRARLKGTSKRSGNAASARLLLDRSYAASRLLNAAAEGSSCLVGTLPPGSQSGEGERVWTVYDVGGHQWTAPTT